MIIPGIIASGPYSVAPPSSGGGIPNTAERLSSDDDPELQLEAYWTNLGGASGTYEGEGKWKVIRTSAANISPALVISAANYAGSFPYQTVYVVVDIIGSDGNAEFSNQIIFNPGVISHAPNPTGTITLSATTTFQQETVSIEFRKQYLPQTVGDGFVIKSIYVDNPW